MFEKGKLFNKYYYRNNKLYLKYIILKTQINYKSVSFSN